MHLKGRLSINFVVVVVILLLDDEKFLVREEDVYVHVLSVPLFFIHFIFYQNVQLTISLIN